MATRFCLARSPVTIVMARFGTRRAVDRNSMSLAFAAPSTGAAATRTTTESSRRPLHSDFPARGMTRTSNSTPAAVSRITVTKQPAPPRSGQALAPRRVRLGALDRGVDQARAVEQDAVVALALFLLAHELQRVLQRRNRRLDRRLDILALQFQAVDFTLDVFEAGLGLFEQQVGAAFGLADDAPRFVFGVDLDVVRHSLRRRQRGLEVLLVLAVLGEHSFHAHDVLAEAVGFAERLFVVVGDGDEKRGDLHRIESAERLAKALLPKVERADIHTRSFSPVRIIGRSAGRRQGCGGAVARM